MTSNSNRHVTSLSSSTDTSPDQGRPQKRAYISSLNRSSYASSDTAESSTAASQARSHLSHELHDHDVIPGSHRETATYVGKPNHRSHRSRASGGFLVSNTGFHPQHPVVTPPRSTKSNGSSDYKGKSVKRTSGGDTRERKAGISSGMRGSPLADHVAADQEIEVDNQVSFADSQGSEGPPVTAPLDVDSVQIVNLALNLSESRRLASRRHVSNAAPPTTGVFAENAAGGSMRYHLQQQQRRSSRNVSPKPERNDRHFSTGSRLSSSQRLNSPLQAGFEDGIPNYHFSASTLARAEKAKQTLELMAQYREILQCLPPLKPVKLNKAATTTTQSSLNQSPTASQAYKHEKSNMYMRDAGRQYNPLQYIRNRKVRARTSRSIDGDAQGFGDISKVVPWVREVRKQSSSEVYNDADCLELPAFFEEKHVETANTSPPSTTGRNTNNARMRRPRLDWTINPSDMLADILWLEQDDNKKLIEDRHGRRIFPQQVELRRPFSQQESDGAKENILSSSSEATKYAETNGSDIKLPEFKSVKHDDENFAEKGILRAREKIRHVRDSAKQQVPDLGRNMRRGSKSRSKSDSSSSDSESDHPRRRQRSGTADTDRGKQILEKQLSQLVANDKRSFTAGEGDNSLRRRDAIAPKSKASSVGTNSAKRLSRASPSHSRSASLKNHRHRDSIAYASSGRASLEVPRTNHRGSIELDFDSTAPSSPDFHASHASDAYVPSISMNLSPPHSREVSPVRSKLSLIKAKIRPHHNRNERPESISTGNMGTSDEYHINDQEDESREHRRRSLSPLKTLHNIKDIDSAGDPSKNEVRHRNKSEDPSGIRGFLKNARHPVNKVSEIIWRKDSSHAHDTSSANSEDDSDVDERQGTGQNKNMDETIFGDHQFEALAKSHPPRMQASYLDSMPVFTTSSEGRGRPTEARDKQRTSSSLLDVREDRVRRKDILQSNSPNKINPVSNLPEFNYPDWTHSATIRRGSIQSRSKHSGTLYDSVLGYPGKQRNGLLVTGLSELDANNRRPSLQDKRQWSLSDQAVSLSQERTTKRDIARVRALLLSSGVKAKGIHNRANAFTDLSQDKSIYRDIVRLSSQQLNPVSNRRKHVVASQILSEDVQLSAKVWQESTEIFCNSTIPTLHSSIETLQSRLTNTLTPLARTAGDEADEVSKDLVTSQTLNVKRIGDKIERMIRTRKRRFRWLRRGGWVLVEWTLVGVMWYVWFLVVICRIILGIGKGVVGGVRWLLFL